MSHVVFRSSNTETENVRREEQHIQSENQARLECATSNGVNPVYFEGLDFSFDIS